VREALDRLDSWLVPTVVLEEFVLVMKKAGLDDSRLGRKLGELLDDKHVQLTSPLLADVKKAVSILGSEKASFIRFNDKLVLSIASRRRLPLLTFDKELKAQSQDESVFRCCRSFSTFLT